MTEAKTIYRFHPVSGRCDLNWSVNEYGRSLKVVSNDHLLVMTRYKVVEFDTEGHRIRVEQTDSRRRLKGDNFRMSLQLSDSAHHHYIFL